MVSKHFLCIVLCLVAVSASGQRRGVPSYAPDDPRIQYTGRIDFTNPGLPRFWQPGVYITVKINGSSCYFILNDEELWGRNHNYLELVVDGKATRLQTKAKRDTVGVKGLLPGVHTITLCKNTEANIGYLELVAVRASELLEPDPKPERKIEFIGNSITCGASSDESAIPCGKGVWQDQHNAYYSYGPVTARVLNAQYHLSAVSGIGLVHSCCDLPIRMPQVFDKVSMRNDTIPWDFSQYQPDVVTICLGQNDGIQDSAAFCSSYVSFIRRLRGYYPHATLVCLTSPMADDRLKTVLMNYLTSVVNTVTAAGDKNVYWYFFSKRYYKGCDTHPDIEEHGEIARELAGFIRKLKGW